MANSDRPEFNADMLAQDVIENPGKPLSQNTGRVLKLEEEFRITDDDGDFFFKSPWEIKVDRNGFIYVREKDKLFKFDKEGKFIKKGRESWWMRSIWKGSTLTIFTCRLSRYSENI
jgi:hypothetical protein